MSTTTTAQTVRGLCTPQQHARTSDARPVTLMELGTGPHAKFAQLKANCTAHAFGVKIRREGVDIELIYLGPQDVGNTDD